MDVDRFDFDLPDEAIALRPARPRDAARMLVVAPDCEDLLTDTGVAEFPEYLNTGDLLVLNDTRVIPARLRARREREGGTGAEIELLLHQRNADGSWSGFARPAKRLKAGDSLVFHADGRASGESLLTATVVQVGQGGLIVIRFGVDETELQGAIERHGEVPLPPYIASQRATDQQDSEDYQTVYACNEGAVAAPTAGLHLTDRMFDALKARGIGTAFLTLHVGAGTFLPVKASDTEDHQMHSERGEISIAVADRINRTRSAGGRIVAVGTTSLRLLESAADESGRVEPFNDSTDIFITPGYRFRVCDALLTNFHLPRSTLFMLVSAFCGLDTMQRAYRHAISAGYRFYSYGDACLLFPAGRV